MLFILLSSLWQKLEQWDHWLFLKINNGFANPFFDAVLPFMRTSENWAPLYLFLIVFMLINFKGKGGWWLLFFLITIAMADTIGTFIFKDNVQRMRPCTDPEFVYHVRLMIKNCSGASSFPSNHAFNHFGMATFFFVTTRHFLHKWAIAGFVWATLIAFAQVYVGVHYPSDVLAGTVMGIFLGTLTGRLYNNRFGFVNFDHQPTIAS